MYRSVALLAVVLAGCSSPAGPASPTPVTAVATAGPTTSAEPALSAKPTSVPRIPVPAELQGKWRTVINDIDKPVLTLDDFHYTIERLGIGTGSVRIDGDAIVFYGSNLCQGEGRYTWSIDGDTLTLAAAGADPCANRADAIRNRPFTRMG